MKYNLTLSSGAVVTVTGKDERDVTGLWIWMCGQLQPKFLNFQDFAVLATEVVAIQILERGDGSLPDVEYNFPDPDDEGPTYG